MRGTELAGMLAPARRRYVFSLLFLGLLLPAFGLKRPALALHGHRHLARTKTFSPEDVQNIVGLLQKVPVKLLSGDGLASGADLPEAPKECSLVSNGKGIRKSKAGERIDETEGPVMRFNGAVVAKKFEADVGSRQDFMVVNDIAVCDMVSRNITPQVKYLLLNSFGHWKNAMNGLHKCIREMHNRTGDRLKIFVVDFIPLNKAVLNIFKALDLGEMGGRAKWVTSGIVGALFLMNMCERVNHFGFMNNDTCMQHYWQGNNIQCSYDIWHRLDCEKVLWRIASIPMELPSSGWLPGSAKLQER